MINELRYGSHIASLVDRGKGKVLAANRLLLPCYLDQRLSVQEVV